MMELVQKYKITVAPLVPPIVVDVAKNALVEKYDLSSIRIVMSGAAPMGKDIQDAFRNKIPNAFLGQVSTSSIFDFLFIILFFNYIKYWLNASLFFLKKL